MSVCTPKHEPLFSEEEWCNLVAQLGLSVRQAEVLRLLFLGSNDKEIAIALDIALPTVRTHMQRMFQRLGAPDRTGLVVEVFRIFRLGEGSLSLSSK